MVVVNRRVRPAGTGSQTVEVSRPAPRVRQRTQATEAAAPPVPPRPALSAAPQGRMLRTTSDRLRRQTQAREEIKEALKSISNCEDAIDRAQQEVEVQRARIEERMREFNLQFIDNGQKSAEMKEGFTRQITKIDPQKFRNKVLNTVFWECVEVSIGKAGQHLGKKEIDAISDITPSTPTGTSLKISDMKKR